MDDDGGWREYAGAIVLPHRRHAFDGCGADVAMVFVEPETAPGRALAGRYAAQAITPIDAPLAQHMVAPLLGVVSGDVDDAALIAAAHSAVSLLTGPAPAPQATDPRIERAIAWMRGRLDTTILLAEAAAQVHLSPSRFRHLFVAQTGMSFRAYLLWARVAAAVAAGMRGGSWTMAAQQAGFADSAHFTRTCQRMFGIAPSMLVKG